MNKPEIDEHFMQEVISQGMPQNTNHAKENKEPRSRKRVSEESYHKIYFKKMEMMDRSTLYVSRATHEKLVKLVNVVGGRGASVGAYVENILLHHFEHYRNELNELYEKHFQKLF